MEKIFKKYLKEKGITIKKAAEILGVTRQYLTEIANGKPCGRKLAKKIEDWTGGTVKHSALLYPMQKNDVEM